MTQNFHKLRTASGSPLWNFPKPQVNSVALGVVVLAGTREERWPEEAGLAHALEHMHFKGTKKFPTGENIDGYIEDVGGNTNAETSKEMTLFEVYIPAKYVKRGVEIVGQLLGAATFPENKIKAEMNTIIQEIKGRNDTPSDCIHKIYDEIVYGGHPLGKDTLGTEEAVAAFKREDFLAFKDQFYTSKNIAFVTAGRITDKDAIELFDEFFPLVPGVKNTRQAEKVPDGPAKSKIEEREIEQVHVILGAITSEAAARDSSILEHFGYMISGGASFPLFQEVRDKRGLCYDIQGGLEKGSDASNFNIYLSTGPKRYKEAIAAVLGVIQKAKSDEKLLERAKTSRIGSLILTFEDIPEVVSGAASGITYLGAPRGYDEMRSEIENITIEDVERVADKYLSQDQLSRAMLVPEGFHQ